MYPYEIFLGMDLYSIFIAVGVILCMVFIRLQSDWRGLRAKLQNLFLFNTIGAVVLGYGFAVLFQAFYNFMAKGKFEITNSTGSTFYGGLIGGTAMFIVIYFIAGHFLFKDKYHLPHLRTASDIAPACITVAHGFGRLGCLMAGCCYGARCDAWYGIKMVHLGYKVVPVQLFEALYLFGLSIIFLVMFKKGKKYLMPAYMMAYAVWRFIAEILRNDYRGATVVAITDSVLSPAAEHANHVLLAKSDMVSLVDSLVAPLSVINAIIVAVASRRDRQLADTFNALEKIWEDYHVYEKQDEKHGL